MYKSSLTVTTPFDCKAVSRANLLYTLITIIKEFQTLYNKLDEIEKNMIVDKLFVRPHQSFLVNMMDISCYGAGTVILSSGYEIPIVKKRYREASEKFKSFAETKGYLF